MASAVSKGCAAIVAMHLAAVPVKVLAAAPDQPGVAAGSKTVTIDEFEFEGDIKPHIATEVRARVAEGLERGALQVVEATGSPALVLHTKVTYAEPDYRLGLVLTRKGNDEPIATAERTCDLCGVQELGELATDLAATIARKASARAQLETKLIVASDPSGAQVLIDGHPAGETPLELDVEPGAYEIVVRMDGYRPRTHELNFDEGERESLSVTLEPEGPDRRSKAFRLLGWTGVGAGLGALGVGTALIVIHDDPITSDCSGMNLDEDGDCKFVHKTLPGGIVLAVTGAALLGTGIAMLVLDRKRTKARRLEALIGPRMVGVRGRF